jgi:hypothetical protein
MGVAAGTSEGVGGDGNDGDGDGDGDNDGEPGAGHSGEGVLPPTTSSGERWGDIEEEGEEDEELRQVKPKA